MNGISYFHFKNILVSRDHLLVGKTVYDSIQIENEDWEVKIVSRQENAK